MVVAFPIGRALSSWTFEPVVAAGLVAAVLYERGRRRIRARAGPGRVVSSRAVACFWIGLALIAFSLMSPFGALDDVLFTAHMGEHLLLGLVAPLFVVWGRPVTVSAWGLDRARRRQFETWRHRVLPPSRFGRSAPFVAMGAVVVHVGAWWLWHIPAVFDAALANSFVHEVEHATLFLAGVALWWPVLGVRWRERVGIGILSVFVASLGTGMLAALVVLWTHPLYTVSPELASWGVNPLSDQQVGGVLMWVPGGLVYLIVASVLLVRWLDEGPSRFLRQTGVTVPSGR